MPVICDKPVLYFYPKKEIDVNVKLNLKGDLGFTYPEYNNGWEFRAKPNSKIAI